MPANVDFSTWLDQIASLQGGWGTRDGNSLRDQGVSNASKNEGLRKTFDSGVTADQFVNTPAKKYGDAYSALMSPLQGLNEQDAQSSQDPAIKQLIASGKVKYVRRGDGAMEGWEPTDAAGLPVSKGMGADLGGTLGYGPTAMPSKLIGVDAWENTNKDLSKPGMTQFDPTFGLVTARANAKNTQDDWYDTFSGTILPGLIASGFSAGAGSLMGGGLAGGLFQGLPKFGSFIGSGGNQNPLGAITGLLSGAFKDSQAGISDIIQAIFGGGG